MLISLDDLKKAYTTKIQEEEAKNNFLLPIYNQLKLYEHKPKITRRELNKIMKTLNLPEHTYYYFKDTIGYELILNYKYNNEYKKIFIPQYHEENLTQTQQLIKGTLRELTFDSIEKYKAELKNIDNIYKHYKEAYDILKNIQSPKIKNYEKLVTLRSYEIHHDKHTYLLTEKLPLLGHASIRL